MRLVIIVKSLCLVATFFSLPNCAGVYHLVDSEVTSEQLNSTPKSFNLQTKVNWLPDRSLDKSLNFMIFAISPIGVFEDGKTFQLDVNVASKPGSKIKINSAQLTRDNQDIELIRFAEIAQWKSLQKSLSYQSLDWHEIHKNRNSQLEINFSTMDRNGHIQTVSQRWKLNTKTTRKTEAGLKSI